MAKPILVGYDPQSSDRCPVAFGLRAARFTGAPVIVASAGEEPSGALDGLDDDASAVAVETVRLDSSSAPRALHEAAEERDAGLLVVGSTSRGTVGRVLPGSTAERLLHGAPCPIAVVPHGWHAGDGLHTIGVAWADTEEGHEALRGGHALARKAGAKLRVLTAVEQSVRTTYAEQEPGGDIQLGKGQTEVAGEHRVRAEARLRDVIAALGNDVEIESDAFVDDPAEAIVAVSRNLDLLVCGSRGYGPLRAVLLGGVSRRVAAEAHCPVIILPRGVESALEALLDAS